jgi:PilZ domain-containing protein
MDWYEEWEYVELLESLPLWAGIAIGVVVSVVVYLIGRRVFARLTNRRAYPRRTGNPTDVFVSGCTANVQDAVVIDRSEGGIGLMVKKPIAPGETFNVRPAEAPGTVPWVPVVVRHCRSVGRDWMVGCQFEQAVHWEVLVWFG